MLNNDLDQSVEFVLAFVVALFALIFLLAWLEQPHDLRRARAWVTSRARRESDAEDPL